MKLFLPLACLSAGLAACTVPPVDEELPPPPPVDGWQMTFNDEFDGEADSLPLLDHWAYDLGAGGWGNQQLEFNTDQRVNAHMDGDGHLLITALKQEYGGAHYTSARLKSEGIFSQRYGKFEARIKLPQGQGLWPAFWLLGSTHASVGWPDCGELDIMEARGSEPEVNHGSAHGPGYSGANPKSAAFTLDSGSFADDFHIFTIEWAQGEVHWFVDGNHYHAIRVAQMPPEQRWVFDDGPMFIILDLAVGGWFGGEVDDSIFPQTMTLDYVRAYEAVETP
jgi:beta-glucanase (GH16 family)